MYTVYILLCVQYTVHYVHCIHITLYTVYSKLCKSTHNTPYTVYSKLCTYTVHILLCIQYKRPYTVYTEQKSRMLTACNIAYKTVHSVQGRDTLVYSVVALYCKVYSVYKTVFVYKPLHSLLTVP